jgi:D-alanyl-D-alanine endopeptidase (penicillin-binding protein 7)
MFSKLILSLLISSQILTGNINSGEVLGIAVTDNTDISKISEIRKINPKNIGVQISSATGLVLDLESEKILFSKDIHQPRPIASITKLMTILTFLDTNPNLEKIIEVLPEDLNGESKRNLYLNEKISLKNILYIALIESDNNATKLLVKHSDLEKEEFLKAMNVKARGMGLKNTSFQGVTGLNENNISTAHEVAKILKTVSKHSLIRQILAVPEYNFNSQTNSHSLKTTNELLTNKKFSWQNILGKTGYTDEAGGCFVGITKLANGKEVISVILGAPQVNFRFDDTKSILSWIAENYSWK